MWRLIPAPILTLAFILLASMAPVVSSQPVVLRVPAVCVDELYRYALSVPLNLDDAKAKVLALKRGETVTVGDCTIRVEE